MATQLAALTPPSADSTGPFDLIGGMPLHPLVVHAVVVLVPLTAIGLLLMAFVPRFSRRLGWLVSLGAAVAAGSAFVAKQAGEAFEARVGTPGFDHAELGTLMPVFAIGLLAVTVALWLVDRSAPAEGPAPRRGLRIAVAILAVLVALGNLFWVFRVGDSGARSVWAGRVAASDAEPPADAAADPSATPTPDPTGTATPTDSATSDDDEPGDDDQAAGTYTLAEVAAPNTPADCWAAIEGSVYDLTTWIGQHPGGPEHITPLCGTDATSAFETQHAGQPQPAGELALFQVGQLTS